jgi:hypothetical protein
MSKVILCEQSEASGAATDVEKAFELRNHWHCRDINCLVQKLSNRENETLILGKQQMRRFYRDVYEHFGAISFL